MNALATDLTTRLRLADLGDAREVARIESFVAEHEAGTPFHRPAWFIPVARATGNEALALLQERRGEIVGYLPMNLIHSPVFGRLLASSGFAVGGGVLLREGCDPASIFTELERLAMRMSCSTIELRGGILPSQSSGWTIKSQSHANFARDLAVDDAAQLLDIPRKQRAEVRKSLSIDLTIRVGTTEADREAHYRVFCESYRNLGTPVFPRGLLDAVVDSFGDDADILTVSHDGTPVAGVISVYYKGAAMPYWGGGTHAARRLRANDRMYYELMLHARRRGCSVFDFGRSKCGSGAYDFKRNWGFDPQPLHYAVWNAPSVPMRDADPASGSLSFQIRMWQRLPLAIANRIGPVIARGIG